MNFSATQSWLLEANPIYSIVYLINSKYTVCTLIAKEYCSSSIFLISTQLTSIYYCSNIIFFQLQIIIQVLEDIAFHHKRFPNVTFEQDVYYSVLLTLGSVAHKLFKTGQKDLATDITLRINAMLGLHGNYIFITFFVSTYLMYNGAVIDSHISLRWTFFYHGLNFLVL